MTKRFYVLFTALIFLLQVTGFSQISSSVLSGCAPLVGVTFTATPGAVNPAWNFGDGATSSILNPTHTFSTPGNYTVTFTANSVSTQSLVIAVHGKPHPHFTTVSTVTAGCIPLSVSFASNSTGGGGTAITGYQWTFGDGGSSTTGPNTTYIYNVGGQFDVSVIVTDANGCDSSFTIHGAVSVSQKPTITISPGFPSACLPPLTVTFACVATSHVPPPQANTLTYLWNFSGGGTSTTTTPPPQVYTTAGVFTQTLTVTDVNGCSNTVLKNVVIQNPTAVFAIADTVCTSDSTRFSPHGSSGGIIGWNYGDGQTGSDSVHFYHTPGTYTVTETVVNGSCNGVATHVIYAEQPVPNFSVTPTYMCSLPRVVSLTNLSTPHNSGYTYQWSYLQSYTQYSVTPSTSAQTNPTFTLSHLDTNRYTINQLDIKDSISLTLTTIHGCIFHKDILYVDTIILPTARFMPDKYQGCVPLTVHFSDSSKVGPHEHITSWKYIFGDGATTTINSSPGNTVHTYTAVGIYYPTLVIQTQSGCGDTSYAIEIEVGSPPVPSFSVSPTSVCIGDNVTLTNTTPTSYSVDTWHYYGDGGYYASSCSNDANVTWPFSHSTGPQNISLEACFRGCCNTTTLTAAVNVKGPLASFKTTMDCGTPNVYNFTGTISDATSWTWDFGDGNVVPGSTASTITHTYTASGDYNAVLTAISTTTGCGPSSYTVVIHVRNIKANFTYTSLLCSGTSYNFDASTSVDVNTSGYSGYVWFWDDGTHIDITSGAAISHSYTITGTHTVTLIVRDINGCEDTLRKKIKSFGITPHFTPSKSPMCVNSVVTFSNTSISDTTIISYNWSFGDPAGGTSTQINPTYTYNITSPTTTSVIVSVVVTNTLGCTATYSTTILISRPSAAFSITSNRNICLGAGVTFTGLNSYPNMTWAYGDGTTLGPTPPTTVTSHTYLTSGIYTTTLSVIDAAGCSDVKTIAQTVNVQDYPVINISCPGFGVPQCRPHQFMYTDNTVLPAGVFLSRTWNLYTGSASITGSVVTSPTYTTPGTYSVTLTETTTNGCASTITKTVSVIGPVANFTLTPS
ncbi:MAG: PKD domain-containing protein, partial [Bacteroidia bacterium]